MTYDPARIGRCWFSEGRFWTMEIGECPDRLQEHPDEELPDLFEAQFQPHPQGFVSGDYQCTICLRKVEPKDFATGNLCDGE